MAETVYVETSRLVWRAPSRADVNALHDIVSNFDVVRQTETWPWPPDRDVTACRCQPIPEDEGTFGVITHCGSVIGTMGFRDGSMGYMLAPKHWGKGFATEIGNSSIEAMFGRFEWPELSACVFTDNPASGRVLEKLGFQVVRPCAGPSAARGGIHPITNYTLPRPRT